MMIPLFVLGEAADPPITGDEACEAAAFASASGALPKKSFAFSRVSKPRCTKLSAADSKVIIPWFRPVCMAEGI